MDKRLALSIVALAVVTTAIGVWMQRSHFSPREKQFSSGFTNHVIAIELVRTPDEIREIVGELGDPNREVMRRKVHKDRVSISARRDHRTDRPDSKSPYREGFDILSLALFLTVFVPVLNVFTRGRPATVPQ